MVMASSLSHLYTEGNAPTDNLSSFVDLSLNGQDVPLGKVRLRNDDISQWYEWEQVVLKNVNLVQGNNTLRLDVEEFDTDEYYFPNQLLLEVFAKGSLNY